MKIQAVYSVTIFFLTLCLSCESQPATYSQTTANNSTTLQPVRSANSNEVLYQLPLPQGWQIVGTKGSGQPYLTGPQQVQVTSLPAETYMYNCNATQAQAAQMQGQQIANPVPLQRILQESLAPQIQQQGGRLITQYPLPQLLAVDQQLTQTVAQANGFILDGMDLLASEWSAADGTKSLILIGQVRFSSRMGFSMWQFYLEELEAPASYFETAKNTYLQALLNKQADSQAIIAQGQQRQRQHQAQMAQDKAMWDARTRSSAINHQNNMAQREAAFQATQATHRATTEAISDMSMQGYWSRSNAADRMQGQSVNAIHGENTIVNPHTGGEMQVQHGYQRTFVDPYGNYYQTDDQFFNPQQHSEFQHYREVGKQ